MGKMEELSEQEKKIWSNSPGYGPGEGARAGQCPCGVGLGDAL